MMRSKPSSAMQKTYDDCYLICSTAVYFESQNNEAEALRSWRNALDQIYHHNASRMPANYRPKNETEKSLQESLHQLELQCKERVDLLEALKTSREEADKPGKDKNARETEDVESSLQIESVVGSAISKEASGDPNSWLGGGTVPPLNYNDLFRPQLLRRPSHTPSHVPCTTSNSHLAHSQNLSKQAESSGSFSLVSLLPSLPSRTPRVPSPEKRSRLLRTLRTNSKDNKSSRLPNTLRSRPQAATKAATQAWGSLSNVSNSSLQSPSNEEFATTRDQSRRQSSDTQSSLAAETRVPSYAESAAASSLAQNTFRTHETSSEPSKLQRYHNSSLQNQIPYIPQKSSPNQSDSKYHSTPLDSITDDLHKGQMREFGAQRKSDSSIPARNGQRPSVIKYDPHTRSLMTQTPPLDAASGSVGQQPKSNITRKAVPNTTLSQPKEDLRGKTTYSGKSSPSRNKSLSRAEPHSGFYQDIVPNKDVNSTESEEQLHWNERVHKLLKHLPRGADVHASKQILNEIVIQGDEVHWSDIAGLEIAKAALKETVVYPFLRPDLFMGLREPARGMLLFGPPGTGKTMLARAVATESKSTFFAISASSLTSKFLGESEKLVRALFALAKALAPSIIFVDEIDSLLSSRTEASEHEATRRIKTEFLIQWSDLARAAAGREQSEKDKERGDASRVLVLAATNLPWMIDEAARRRFVRRQYIPLPEAHVRKLQLKTLLNHQKHTLTEGHLDELVGLTSGFSGSDITALAKDAAMGPLRSLGEKLLHMGMDDIRPIQVDDFRMSLKTIRPSVGKEGLKKFDDWARDFGERGG